MVMLPPATGFSTSSTSMTDWRRKALVIPPDTIMQYEMSTDYGSGEKLRFELAGPGVYDVMGQMRGGPSAYSPAPAAPAPVNHQDEALAAARRDLNEANARAAASRQLAVELEESLQDYEGEINALRKELGLEPKEGDRWLKKFAVGGVVKPATTIFGIDPGNPAGSITAVEYSAADAMMTTKIVRELAKQVNEIQGDSYSPIRYGKNIA